MVNNLARKIAELSLPRARSDQPPISDEEGSEPERRPRLHWLVTGSLISGAMWAVLIAIIMAAFGNWKIVAFLLGLAVVLIGVLSLGLRRTSPKPRHDDAPPSDQG